MGKKATFGDFTGDSRPGGSDVVTKKKIPDLHKGTKKQAEKAAKAGPLADGSQMPKLGDELEKIHLPREIPVEDTNVRVIKERK